MLALVKAQNLTSIADLIGLRYGKSLALAAGVALICLMALIPCISLQLHAVAFESVAKLATFAIVGAFVCWQLFDGSHHLIIKTAADHTRSGLFQAKENGSYIYVAHSPLRALSMFVLPTQFHVHFIENTNADEFKKARCAFLLYLFFVNFFILPIARGGMSLAPEMHTQDAFLLALPILADRPDISLVAFITGLSIATKMVIMATLALSIMVSNDAITPLWIRARRTGNLMSDVTAQGVLLTRRRISVNRRQQPWRYVSFAARHQGLVYLVVIAAAESGNDIN